MRVLRVGLVGIVAATMAACVLRPPAALPAPHQPTEPPQPTAAAATPLPTSTAGPSPTSTPLPAALPWARAQVEGPLVVDGQPLKGLVIGPRPSLRYGLLADGLARSEDGGKSWRRVSDEALPRLLVSPHDPRALYAGDMPSCYKGDESPIFRRSVDGGETWQTLKGGQGIRPVAVHPAAAADLYGLSCAGLNVSRDNGENWQAAGPTQGWDVSDILPLAEGGMHFLAVLTSEGGTSGLAWFDEDGRLDPKRPPGPSFWGLGVLAKGGSTLYVAESTGVWRSDDDGAEWDQFKEGLADVTLAVSPMSQGLSEKDMERGFGLLALAPDPANPERLALGTVRGLYLSRDRGQSWLPAGVEALAQSRIDRLAWDPDASGTLYVTTPEGVFVLRTP